MSAQTTDDRSSTAPGQRQRLRVAIAGGDLHAAAMLRLLTEVESIEVVAIAEPRAGAAGLAAARESGVPAYDDLAVLGELPDIDVVIDLTADPVMREALVRDLPADIDIVSGRGTTLLHDLLIAQKRNEEQERLLSELTDAYDKIRGHEERLEMGTRALEQTNMELESRLSEIFFTHEFFKALTSFVTVEDVTSLVVDGANGILGAEISAVYLLDTHNWTLRLAAAQGRPRGYFVEEVPADSTLLGVACRDGWGEESEIVRSPDALAGWATEGADLTSHAAVALRSGEDLLGALVIGSALARALSPAEVERLHAIGHQSSLALQNALLHEQLERLSVTDRLTGLYNHGYFQQRFAEEFSRAQRSGRVLSLIMVDIDNFKKLNDTYGHPRGDRVLRAVASSVDHGLRDIDFVARYGGEEFVVVLPETDAEGALVAAERLRTSIEAIDFEWLGFEPGARVTVSVGVATFPLHATDEGPLIVAADQAMYCAKRSGKNTVCVAPEL